MAAMKTIQIQKNKVSEEGEALGIRKNCLALLLGLEKGSDRREDNATDSVPRWAVDLLLTPQNITFLQVVGLRDKLLFTTALSTEADSLLFSEQETLLNLRSMPRSELALMLSDLLAVGMPEKKSFNLTMSRQAAYAAMALADVLKRQQLTDLLLHAISEEAISREMLQEEAAYALQDQDFRWLLPNLLTLTDEKSQPDIKQGLKELAVLAVVEIKKDQIRLTEAGRKWMEDLLERETIGGMRSLFYEQDQLTLLTGCLIRTDRHLYYIELGEQVRMVMLDRDQAAKLLEMFLAPGDPVPFADRVNKPAPAGDAGNAADGRGEAAPDSVKPRPKFCKHCGANLTEGAKFCPSCGKQII